MIKFYFLERSLNCQEEQNLIIRDVMDAMEDVPSEIPSMPKNDLEDDTEPKNVKPKVL